MPTIGRLNITRSWPVSPGLMVAELATASTPQAQPPGLAGSARISPIASGALPVLVNANRYSTGWL